MWHWAFGRYFERNKIILVMYKILNSWSGENTRRRLDFVGIIDRTRAYCMYVHGRVRLIHNGPCHWKLFFYINETYRYISSRNNGGKTAAARLARTPNFSRRSTTVSAYLFIIFLFSGRKKNKNVLHTLTTKVYLNVCPCVCISIYYIGFALFKNKSESVVDFYNNIIAVVSRPNFRSR